MYENLDLEKFDFILIAIKICLVIYKKSFKILVQHTSFDIDECKHLNIQLQT